jgi:hypothetical protein
VFTLLLHVQELIDDEDKYNAMFEWKTRPLDEPVALHIALLNFM